jgi:hypothetical protein
VTGPKWEGDLEWEEDPYYAARGDLAYRADFPWLKGVTRLRDTQHYSIYEWKDGWAYGRTTHGVLGEFSGWRDRLDDAKAECLADFEKVRRIHEWIEYIKSHDPPRAV